MSNQSFGEKCFIALGNARTKAGGVLNRETWIKVVDDLVAVEGVFRKKRPSSKQPKAGRPRNPLFDALALGTGVRDLTNITRTQGKPVGVALADILEVSPEVTVEEIRRVIAAYKSRHPTWPCTAMAIAKHWAEFARSAPTNASKTDVYVEPQGPWREIAAQMYPASKDWVSPHDFATIKWLDVAATLRTEILRKVYS